MLTITDLFCGAGGSSSGAEQVPGVTVRMAANHWKLAVDTHQVNLPHADHDCADISQTDPRRYPATDLLWASPECTNHSQARGRRRTEDTQPDLFGQVLPDEAAERSRATMWDVCRFVEAMSLRGRPYRGFVVENVVDVRQWMFFDAWKTALRSAGYCLHEVFLNSMFAGRLGDPAPQSRDRWYCLGHLADRCPDLDRWTRPAAWCPTCDTTVTALQAWKRPDRRAGRYRAQYVYRCPNTACRNSQVGPWVLPAAAAIDWTIPGDRIGDRARPLAPKTVARIQAGLRRYGPPLAVPVEGRDGLAARPTSRPHRTQTGRCETALLVPAGGTWNDAAASAAEPFRTRTTRDTEALVIPPGFVMRNNTARGDQGQMCTPLVEPLRTLTTAGHQSLVMWMVVDYNGPARPVSEPLPTQTTVEGDGLCSVEPAVDDCLFRMLEPHEIQAAMAFAGTYRVLGNKRERVRQLGNAVTPPAARDLIAALAEVITGAALDHTGRPGQVAA